jgi:hypothetical protein
MGVRSTGGEREVPADKGCPDGETSSRGITDPYPLYIERMFCPRLCISIEATNHHLYIPTGYEPGLNALPIRKRADIRARRTCRFSLLASAPHPYPPAFESQHLSRIASRRHRQMTGPTVTFEAVELLNVRNYRSWSRT